MDAVSEIKARLPIEELVGQYCQLQKKGRNFVCLCPFHNDKHPSFLVSPDKGIGYCFACQNGGDIFTFYQRIESVDFRQALHDLAERAGVTLPERAAESTVKKDEKERLRDCLAAAQAFYRKLFQADGKVQAYVQGRGVPPEQIKEFGLGLAPDSFSATYEHLLKEGFSRREIVTAGLGVQKDLEGKIYDRFRNRLIFPIHDGNGRLIGFGGRALGDDDAKYLNSSESPLYHKSDVLYGLHHAKDAIRSSRQVIMVEGYFDVLACHRVGVNNVVAVSGTALTEQHVRLLKRNCDTVILCLDQDRAGQAAAERAYTLCSNAGLLVRVVVLSAKDPADAILEDPKTLEGALRGGGEPYVDMVLRQLSATNLADIAAKRAALARLLPLLQAIQSSTERDHYVSTAAATFGTTAGNLQEDLERLPRQEVLLPVGVPEAAEAASIFTRTETTLGLFLVFPMLLPLLDELIEPGHGFSASLYKALKALREPGRMIDIDALQLTDEERQRARILQLFWEHHEADHWSENIASREIRKNCMQANKELINQKLRSISQELRQAERDGKVAEREKLKTQSKQLTQLKQTL